MIRVVTICLAAGLLWAAVYYVHWVCVRRRFVVVTPGRVYQSAAMSPGRLIRCLRRHGIDTVVDFRGAHEKPVQVEARALAEAGMKHINIPSGLLPTPEAIRRFTEVMAEERTAGRRALLHCKDGEGRAIAFAAIYRMEFEGSSPWDAYRGASRLPPLFRFVSILFPRQLHLGLLSPRNCKTRLILDYRPTAAPPSAPRAVEPTTAG